MLYVIEGCDAAGKATQAKILADKIGCGVLTFPNYESPSGQMIKRLLTDDLIVCQAGAKYEPYEYGRALVLQSLMVVNRMEQFAELEAASNDLDRHLVLDRYYASGFVYGSIEGLDPEWLATIHSPLPAADYWILLDLDPTIGFLRRPERRDRNETDRPKLLKVREGYKLLWQSQQEDTDDESSVWAVVDGSRNVDEVSKDIALACMLTEKPAPVLSIVSEPTAAEHLVGLEREFAVWKREWTADPNVSPETYVAVLDGWIKRIGEARAHANIEAAGR